MPSRELPPRPQSTISELSEVSSKPRQLRAGRPRALHSVLCNTAPPLTDAQRVIAREYSLRPGTARAHVQASRGVRMPSSISRRGPTRMLDRLFLCSAYRPSITAESCIWRRRSGAYATRSGSSATIRRVEAPAGTQR